MGRLESNQPVLTVSQNESLWFEASHNPTLRKPPFPHNAPHLHKWAIMDRNSILSQSLIRALNSEA